MESEIKYYRKRYNVGLCYENSRYKCIDWETNKIIPKEEYHNYVVVDENKFWRKMDENRYYYAYKDSDNAYIDCETNLYIPYSIWQKYRLIK